MRLKILGMALASTVAVASTVHAASAINLSAWGFANSQTPHIACTILSGASGERVNFLIYAEANRQVNNQTNPIFYVGRPGNPLANPSAYYVNDDWDTESSASMISAVGRTPVNSLDSGDIMSGPTGPMCIYAFEKSPSTEIGYINLQITFLGSSANRTTEARQPNDMKFRALSKDELAALPIGGIPTPSQKSMPNSIENVIVIPEEFHIGQ